MKRNKTLSFTGLFVCFFFFMLEGKREKERVIEREKERELEWGRGED